MQLRIGENIKRLRREKDITQEQLAEMLNISCAAVSKWEHGDTYPDITMIFPIAHFFGVSTDELMGYSTASIEAEIDMAIEQYKELNHNGKFAEAKKLITKARKEYPNDYRIMLTYMLEVAGGRADNKPEVLIKYNTEFSEICDCILEGCTDEVIRLEAMTMKAKLLHAAGETARALEIIDKLPSWYQTCGQKGEQLFAKDTPEFRRRLQLNLFELAQFTIDKMMKYYWYADEGTLEQREKKAEEFGDMLTQLRLKQGNEAYCLIEFTAFACLSSYLTHHGGSTSDIIRYREKELAAAKACSELANKNDIVREHLVKTYGTGDLLKWMLDWLSNTNQKENVDLIKNPDFLAVLNKYRV